VVSQLSEAAAVPGLTVAEHVPGSVFAVMFAGQLIIGAVWSATVKVMSFVAVLVPSFASI
jgi:hypothetical protein